MSFLSPFYWKQGREDIGNWIKTELEPRLWLQAKGITVEEHVTWLSQSGHLGPPQATVIGSGTAM